MNVLPSPQEAAGRAVTALWDSNESLRDLFHRNFLGEFLPWAALVLAQASAERLRETPQPTEAPCV